MAAKTPKPRASKKRAAPEPAVGPGDRDPRAPYDGPVLGSFGISGLKRNGGYLQEEFIPALKGRKKDKVFREMEDNSPLISGALYAMEALARQVEWRFDPPADSGEAGQHVADFYEECREDMESQWEELISEIMSFVGPGWAYFETLYKLRRGDNEIPELRSKHDDGRWGWRDIAIRSQDSRLKWEFDRDGNLRGMWQQVDTDSALRFVPIEKALLFRFRSRKNSPEGRGLLRGIYRPWYLATNKEDIEAVGLERAIAGLPVFEVPLSAMQSTAGENDIGFRRLAEALVKNIRNDGAVGAVIPASEDRNGSTGFKLSLLSAGGNPEAANVSIMRHRTDIMIGMLMQFLLLGSGQTGSWSLASEMTDLLAMAMNAILRSIAGVFSRVAVPQLGRLNGFDPALYPTLSYTDIEKPDVQKLWATLQSAVTSGLVVPDDSLERWAREQSGWPVPTTHAPGGGTAQRSAPAQAEPGAAKVARMPRAKLFAPRHGGSILLPPDRG